MRKSQCLQALCRRLRQKRRLLWRTGKLVFLCISLDTAKALSKSDGCKSVSEYIEKAVDFYNAYLCNRRAPELISSETVDTLRRVLDKCEHARSSALFKLSVEISMLLNVIAATNDIEDEDLGKLRHACIEEVRRINGSVSLDNAIEWQK